MKIKKIGPILLVLAVFILAVVWKMSLSYEVKTTKKSNSVKAPLNTVKTISAKEFDELAKDPETFVLDVHTPEQTHIPGTDAFIPYNEIEKSANHLPVDKSSPILVYCRSGSMSKQASEDLIGLGYSNVYDLAGGINAYKEFNSSVNIAPNTQDLGTVIYGDIAKTEFTLTNFTSNPLKIIRVSTSCGCTSAEIIKKELQPYEETKINVSFDPAVHKDDTDLGEITRSIYINTDSAEFNQLTVEINARVIKK